MANMKQTITNHNKQILRQYRGEENTPKIKNCNCRKKDACPMNGNCLQECVIYEATVTNTATKKEEHYIGLTKNTFKERYTAHTSSFKLASKRKSTTLSEHIIMVPQGQG